MPPVIDEGKCVPCGRCVDVCPTDVFYGSFNRRDVPRVAYPDECFLCNLCVEECPTKAISLEVPLPLRLWTRRLDQEHTRKARFRQARLTRPRK